MSRKEALARSPRVTFDTPELLGSISLKGARIDDVQLAKYRVDHRSQEPTRCRCCRRSAASIPTTPSSAGRRRTPRSRLPGPDTLWTADQTTVAPGKPVRLTWDNGQGLIFALEIAIDDFFMFDVKQSVENKSDKPVTLFPWSLVVRYGEPKAEGIYILHEGPYGVFNGSLKEFGYSDFKDNKQQKISHHRRLGRHHRQVLDGDPGARPEVEGRRVDQADRHADRSQVPDRLCRRRA